MKWASAARFAVATYVAILSVHTTWVVWFAWERTYFANDDLRTFWLSAVKPFGEFVLFPIDDHFVPLHRIVCFVLFRVAPMNFYVGMGLLAAIQLATLYALYRVLDAIRADPPLNAALVCLYGLQASLGGNFLWWTAGLGRLGCFLFSILAIRSYLAFRAHRSRGELVLTILCSVCALGFYVKGILVLAYLVGIELALPRPARPRTRMKNLLVIALSLVPAALVYVLVWQSRTPGGYQLKNLDPLFYLRFVGVTLPLFAETALGFFLDSRVAVVLLVLTCWGGAVLYTVRRSRAAWIAWALLVSFAALNFCLVALSAVRVLVFGLTLAQLDRYYFDSAFLVPIFGVIALSRGDASAPGAPSSPRAWGAPAYAALAALLVVLSWSSRASLVRIQSAGDFGQMLATVKLSLRATATAPYATGVPARRFILTLREHLEKLPDSERHPLSLVESPLPWFVVPWGDIVKQSSDLLAMLGQEVSLSPHGKYVVDPSGAIALAGAPAR